MSTFYNLFADHFEIIRGCLNFMVTIAGATITQLLSMHIGTIGTINFLRTWYPDKQNQWYEKINCVLLIAIGSIISFIILEPETIKTSLFAGLTWCGTLQSIGLIKETTNED